ncbi:unnamed protein product [Phytophthora lilii]|uniref:Unnamed protein product n=1 Tax=Phytophthora lilii TaxID=2077276 RepID=A0A9W6WUL2_9STRA|nr:unnamed protein product [Phytophthora lilii]
MTRIFKNTLIDCADESVIGHHMYKYNEARKQSLEKPARKLIGSYFGEKILIYAPLLKWYISHGLKISKTYCFIKASSHKAFDPFMEAVSNARREGDVDKSKAMIAEMMKLVGNSAFGRFGMDMSKHKEVKYEYDNAIKSKIEHFTFHGLEELNDSCEITMKKRRLNNKNPIHLSIAIYQLAKLRMLQFYYDCIDFYFDRSDFQYQEMDTDSGYIAFSCENPLKDCIKPELRDHFDEHKYEWFPRDYNAEVAKFDRRTPRLFKEEWRGDAMVSLSVKSYICFLPDEEHKVKVSAKGIQQGRGRNADVLNPDSFETVVRNRVTLRAPGNVGRYFNDSTQRLRGYIEGRVKSTITKKGDWRSTFQEFFDLVKDRDDVDLFTNEDTTKLAKAFEPRDGEARHGIKIGIDEDMNSFLTNAENDAKKILMDYYSKIVSEGV